MTERGRDDERPERARLHERAMASLAAGLDAAARAGELARRAATLTGDGTDDRTGTRALVDHRGLLTDLHLTSAALDAGTAGIRTAVLDAYRAALADVRAQAAPLQGPPVDLADTSLLDDFDALLRGPAGGRR